MPSASKGLIVIAPPLGTEEKNDKALSVPKKKKFYSMVSVALRESSMSKAACF